MGEIGIEQVNLAVDPAFGSRAVHDNSGVERIAFRVAFVQGVDHPQPVACRDLIERRCECAIDWLRFANERFGFLFITAHERFGEHEHIHSARVRFSGKTLHESDNVSVFRMLGLSETDGDLHKSSQLVGGILPEHEALADLQMSLAERVHQLMGGFCVARRERVADLRGKFMKLFE